MRQASAPNFATVDAPATAAPTCAPRMLTMAAKTIAPAAMIGRRRVRGGIVAERTQQVLAEHRGDAPVADARISTSSAQPKRKPASRPQPSRR